MAKTKKTKTKKTKKRAYKRKGYFSLPLGVPSGIAKQRTVSLRYVDQTTLTSQQSFVDAIYFRANGIQDPQVALGGHQPMGFDQWALLYNYYTVISSRIQVIMADDESQTQPYVCGIFLDDNANTPYSDLSGYIEARKGSYRVSTAKQSSPLRLKSTFNCKSFFNVTDPKDNHQTLGANVTTNPSNEAYYTIWLQALNGDSNSTTCVIIIDYLVTFMEPKSIAQS